jgi:hypothetical protein
MLIGTLSVLAILFSVALCAATGAFEGLRWLWLLPCSGLGAFLGLGVLYFLLLWISCSIVRMDKPREKSSLYYRLLVILTAQAAITAEAGRMRFLKQITCALSS